MDKSTFRKYKNIIEDSIDIVDNLVYKTSYPTIIMTKDFKIIFVNERALKLYNTSFDETFMKNYFGTYCKNEKEHDEFVEFYGNVSKNRKPVYVNNEFNDSYIMIFPIISEITNEVEYYHNVFIVEETHMSSRDRDEIRFSQDYIYFAHQISLLIEANDKYTANHSANVAKYCEFLGKSIGLSDIELSELKLAASLHDVGKVSIPNNILNKAEPLTSDEYEIIKDHTDYSGKILDVFEQFAEIHTAGKYHHERYDGKGYPGKLSGRDIPLYARIIAIADAFDAMTTDRPYRDAYSLDMAVKELIANSGTQFDPFLVVKFINLDLKGIMDCIKGYEVEFTDKFTIPKDKFPLLRENLVHMFKEVDPFVILENMIEYNFYGALLAKDLKPKTTADGNRFELLFKNDVIDILTSENYLVGNWEMCLKERRLLSCNHCPVDSCINIGSTYAKIAKLSNNNGNTKYLRTYLHPLYDNNADNTYIFELFRDVSVFVRHNNETEEAFYSFVDNLSRIFAEQNKEFSIIYNEMRSLCNWIAQKIGISKHKVELLNSALSICDLGIISLIDSSVYTFESMLKLRTNKKHIEIIYNMITKLTAFAQIKEIVLYHHTDYNDTTSILSGDQVPIQSYIISMADLILTRTVTGESIDDTFNYIMTISGVKSSPIICSMISKSENKDELYARLQRIIN